MPNAKLEAFFGEKRKVTINEKWKKGWLTLGVGHGQLLGHAVPIDLGQELHVVDHGEEETSLAVSNGLSANGDSDTRVLIDSVLGVCSRHCDCCGTEPVLVDTA